MELLVRRLGGRAVRRGIRGWEQAFPALLLTAQLWMEAVHCAAGRRRVVYRKLILPHKTHIADSGPEWALQSPVFALVWM